MLRQPNEQSGPKFTGNLLSFVPIAVGMCLVGGGLFFYAAENMSSSSAPPFSAGNSAEEEKVSDVVGQPAAAVFLESMPGQEVFSDQDLRAGTTKIVYFFASWSFQSLSDLKVLNTLAEQHNIEILGIAVKDHPENVQRLLVDLGNPFSRIGLDRGKTLDAWGQNYINALYVIDGNGMILHRELGLSDFSMLNRVIPAIEASK